MNIETIYDDHRHMEGYTPFPIKPSLCFTFQHKDHSQCTKCKCPLTSTCLYTVRSWNNKIVLRVYERHILLLCVRFLHFFTFSSTFQ